MMTDDMEMVREYAARQSEPAFAALVDRYVNLVYSAGLRQVGDPHLAEEVTQAVFIILARKAGSLGPETILPSWLHRTACFVAADALKTGRRRRQRETEAHMQTLLNEPAAEREDVWPHIEPLLDMAITGLSEPDRRAIVLRYFENRSLAEVGRALGANEDAARMRVNRALEKLRKFFLKRGVVSTTAMLAGAMAAHSVQAAPASLTQTATLAAMAKGMAATGSAALLAKGGLKLMVWSKLKMAAGITLATVLAAGTATTIMEKIQNWRAGAALNLQGAWEGVMLLDDAGVTSGSAASVHVVLKLTKTSNGYTATTDWIEKGRKDVPMGRVVYDYPSLRLEWNPRSTWNLKVKPDGTEMILDHATHFTEPDPVALRRTTTPDAVPERLADSDFAPRTGSDLQGYWKGRIGTNSDAIPVDLKIAEQPDGTFRAEGDDPMRGANGQPGTVVYTRPKAQLKLASGAGMFQGEINRDHTEISGSWIQGGQSLPTTVKRADYQAEHTQDALRDYSFVAPDDLPGHWKGVWILPYGNVKVTMRYNLDIAKLPNDTLVATISSPDQFGNDDPIPTSEAQYDLPGINLTWKWAGLRFEGKLKNGKLAGTWFQGGYGFPLTFERQP